MRPTARIVPSTSARSLGSALAGPPRLGSGRVGLGILARASSRITNRLPSRPDHPRRRARDPRARDAAYLGRRAGFRNSPARDVPPGPVSFLRRAFRGQGRGGPVRLPHLLSRRFRGRVRAALHRQASFRPAPAHAPAGRDARFPAGAWASRTLLLSISGAKIESRGNRPAGRRGAGQPRATRNRAATYLRRSTRLTALTMCGAVKPYFSMSSSGVPDSA